MGIGMVLAVDASDVTKVIEAAKSADVPAYAIGEVTEGEKGVTLC